MSVSGVAGAVDSIRLGLGSLEGAGWRIADIELSVGLNAAGSTDLRLRAERIELPGLPDPIRKLDLRCPKGKLSPTHLSCSQGVLRWQHPKVPQQGAKLRLAVDRESGQLDLELGQIAVAGGQCRFALTSDGAAWQMRLDGQGIEADQLRRLLSGFGIDAGSWELSGRLSPHVELVGDTQGPTQLNGHLELGGLEFSGPEGELLGAGLVVAGRAELRYRERHWQGKIDLSLNAGELLTPAFYLGVGEHPVTLSAEVDYHAETGVLAVKDLGYRHPEVLAFDATGEVWPTHQEPFRRLNVKTSQVSLPALYASYLQPLLAEGPLADLDSAGTFQLQAGYQAGGPAEATLELQDLSLQGAEAGSDTARRRPFGFWGVNGRLVWRSDQAAPGLSRLRWERGHLLETVEIGPSELAFGMQGDRVALALPAEIPVLDGSLLLDRFALSPGADAAGRLEFDAVLTPISMGRLSQAFGWPEMSGKLSGVIPDLSYEQGRLEMAGNLLVRVFDGEVLVRHLRMEDLLGVWPVLMADLELRNLDLERLTGTFSFGKITGRLEGRVDGLRLEDWSPVAFDARFNTPQGDDSRHRVSQRAVDNISDLGGAGISGALSRSFLRGFEEFRYRRLGISCHLRQGICEMGGVAPADNGYYLVEGAGLPRIDIVGFNQRTDWQLLVDQLKNIGAAGTPVVE